jgi:hypothetical protein
LVTGSIVPATGAVLVSLEALELRLLLSVLFGAVHAAIVGRSISHGTAVLSRLSRPCSTLLVSVRLALISSVVLMVP